MTVLTVTKISTYADQSITIQPTANPTKEKLKMANHNFTGYTPSAPLSEKRRVAGITATGGPALLRALEGLGLLAHSPELHKLVASGATSISAVGEHKKWSPYEIDQAFKDVNASVSERLAFKANLSRLGLMRPNEF
jgi:hypothetical protein